LRQARCGDDDVGLLAARAPETEAGGDLRTEPPHLAVAELTGLVLNEIRRREFEDPGKVFAELVFVFERLLALANSRLGIVSLPLIGGDSVNFSTCYRAFEETTPQVVGAIAQ
jgi:hypothetical protein